MNACRNLFFRELWHALRKDRSYRLLIVDSEGDEIDFCHYRKFHQGRVPEKGEMIQTDLHSPYNRPELYAFPVSAIKRPFLRLPRVIVSFKAGIRGQ